MNLYVAQNRANWDERAPAHAASPDYEVDKFLEDPAFLSNVVRFDRPRLGKVDGLRGAHLQCHIGTDTLSLSRLGARMTGLDFSPAAVTEARSLAAKLGDNTDFVTANVYDAVDALGAGAFDFVYTSIGVICWLPDIQRWARVVAELLRPGGRLFLREIHQMLWATDRLDDGTLAIEGAYFERDQPITGTGGGTYVQTDVVFQETVAHQWSHGLAEIITALLAAGLDLTMFVEHDSVHGELFPGAMESLPNNEWRLTDRPWRLPHSYTIQAVKRP
ncbi:class I SAM-dependent methyltransferase [Fodinicola feengrottensis]|uniref:Class I SAM-dependent methyltransferase n=1 Tax=Fodinicola feengrottensis TaxID=435914 RepID=A0ABP4UW44_9ACTN|nr:class I SAM-dependent methyltransferase [Fodinicola feengrottensis]